MLCRSANCLQQLTEICLLFAFVCAACRQLFAWKRIWIVTMVLNSCYSFYWDVEQDWDMPWIMQYGAIGLAELS
jgi:hypothetical protein